MRLASQLAIAAVGAWLTVGAGVSPAGSSGAAPSPALPTILSGAGPDGPRSIAAEDFVSRVDNPYFPLRPGTTFRYRGAKDGRPAFDVYRVTHRVRTILGVTCTVVRDDLFVGGHLAEKTADWYAQDRWGRVWYFGEATAELSPAGKVTSTEGSWEAGVGGARPGIFMSAAPRSGQTFRQEYFKGHAEDQFRVLSLTAPITVPSGFYPDALLTREWTPLEPAVVDLKYYVRGVGKVSEEAIRGHRESSELVSISRR